MDAIERAIRNAFEKGDAEDRTFREKVYRQAFAALDRAMQAHPDLTVEAAIGRRKSLQNKIAAIETEFLPAVPAGAVPAVDMGETAGPGRASLAPSIDAPASAPGRRGPEAPSVEPFLGGSTEPQAGPAAGNGGAPRIEMNDRPGSPPEDIFGAEITPDRDAARAERRRPFAAVFVGVTLLAAVSIGGWWAYQTGLFQSAEERDTAVPNPPQIVIEEDFAPESEGEPLPPGAPVATDSARNWITVFSPADPTQANVPAGAEAEVMQDESGSFLRIRSGASESSVTFDVGQGVIERIAGRTAVFDIVARAEDGQETEISVACDFGALGDCGRKRYVVGYERAEYLFEVALPAGEPAAGGSIAIDSDFGDGGKAVDIYEIRVSVTE